MIKFIGICMLLGSAFSAGGILAYQVRQRIWELNYIKKLMLMFRGELDYKNSALSDAFLAVAYKAKGVYKELLEGLANTTEENCTISMAEVFYEKIDTILKGNTYLKKEDIERLKEFGDTLGYQNQKMQLSHIDLYIDRLSLSIEEEREKMTDTIKVYRTLAMMTGVLISIVLL